MGTLQPDPRNSLLRVSRYLNTRVSSFVQLSTTIMSLLPNIREFSDNDLAKSLSDSEELLTLKYDEWMRQRQEAQEHCKCEECKRREQEEQECHEHEECECCEHEEWEHCEHEVQEAWEARERRDRKEREKSARKEVRRGKVSAQ